MNSLFRFERPYYLYLLFGVLIIILLIIFIELKKKKKIKKLGDSKIVNKMIAGKSKKLIKTKYVFFILAYISLVFAMANPQVGSKVETVERKGVDLVICLDISNSMLAQDIKPNRLERAKQSIYNMLDNLTNDRIGLVVFAGKAYMQLPLTTDYNAIKMVLSNITTDYIKVQGTAMADAIDKAVVLLDNDSPTSKAIIVITDGEDHLGNVSSSVENAIKQNIHIHTIGIGLPGGSPIPIVKNGLTVGFKKDKSGNTIVTKLDEKTLIEVAKLGKGVYVRSTNTRVGLKSVFDEINKMDEIVFDEQRITGYRSGFQLLIAISLIFLILAYFIPLRKNEKYSLDVLFKEKDEN